MRSRYSAFVVADGAYLLRTWHISTRPGHLDLGTSARTWTGLQIVDSTGGGLFDRVATVRFKAHYRQDGRPGIQTENSRFVREDQQWFYVDAVD